MAELHSNDLITQFKSTPPPNIFHVINSLFPELSDRETIAFYWLSQGFQINEISTAMKVKPETIKTYLTRCKQKLNQKDNLELRLLYQCRMNTFMVSCHMNIFFNVPYIT